MARGFGKVVNCRRQRYDVYVGRPSKWGNPFVIGRDGERDAVISKFRVYLLTHPALLEDCKRELRNKVLGCWCAPKRCHAEVLVELANEDDGS
jgi:hypothetical protein